MAVSVRPRHVVRSAFNEHDVVLVRAEGAGQDAHEVTVVTQVLQQARHAPARTGRQRVTRDRTFQGM